MTSSTPPPPRQKKDQLRRLLEQWTRADVMARIGPLAGDKHYCMDKINRENEIRELLYGTSDLVIGPLAGDKHYCMDKINRENEIRELLYGTSDLVKLGLKFKIIKER
jgi:hypothetical protein